MSCFLHENGGLPAPLQNTDPVPPPQNADLAASMAGAFWRNFS